MMVGTCTADACGVAAAAPGRWAPAWGLPAEPATLVPVACPAGALASAALVAWPAGALASAAFVPWAFVSGALPCVLVSCALVSGAFMPADFASVAALVAGAGALVAGAGALVA